MQDTIKALPEIPSKRYFTIGEVSGLCQVKPHVLRYWEQEFPTLSPSKRRGNRRYYQKKDILLIREIRSLLYEQGFTISGAKQKISGEKPQENKSSSPKKNLISSLINELEQLHQELASKTMSLPDKF
ncbi:MAG: MerR family transcriptional regulator [Cellvibrionales bacterium]|nr:MerR family transcriptional regulator [Cellvibrionales bacterium]